MTTETDDNFWTFATSADGELHVWTDVEMPPADNVIRVPLRRDGHLVRIAAADLATIRQLIGTETRDVIVYSGPDAAYELEDLLTRIHAMAQSRIDELRGDDDDEPPTPRM